MAYTPHNVTVAATGTLIFQTSTGVAPDPSITGLVFQAGAVGDPVPIMILVPSGATFVIVGSSGAAIGSTAGIVGPATIPLNVIGNSSMYGAIAGGGTVTVIVGP